MSRRAAIYTRISQDDSGAQTSTARQERHCRAWVEAHGWQTCEVFEDVDRSAYRPGVVRDRFEALLDEVSQRRIDVVVVWRLDRLVRSPAEFERFWAACQAAGVDVASATEPVDSTNPVGVALLRMLVTFAGLESDVKGIRLRSRHRELAERGVPAGGGLPYGFADGCTRIVEREAALIREAAQRILDGEGTTAITRDWAERGVVGRKGTPITAAGLRYVLNGRAICGDRSYKGEVVAIGCWPAIIDQVTAAQVRVRLHGRTGIDRPNTVEYLLRGLVRCGSCGEKMSSSHRPPYRILGCTQRLGCGRLSIVAEPTEAWIAAEVLRRLAARQTRDGRRRWNRTAATAAVRALNDDAEALRALNSSYFVDGDITHPEWMHARDQLMLRSSQHVARAAPPQRPPGFPPGLPLSRAADVWDELTVPTRRAVVRTELAWLTVLPSTASPGMWSAARLEPQWLTEDPPGETTSTIAERYHRKWATPRGGRRQLTDRVPSADHLRDRGGPYPIAEACRVSGRGRYAIDQARREGRLPATVIDGFFHYALKDLDSWAANPLRRQATSPATLGELVSEAKARNYLAVGMVIFRRLIDEGDLTPIGSIPGAGLIFTRQEIDACIDRCRVVPTGEGRRGGLARKP